jgi:hypothetical protein
MDLNTRYIAQWWSNLDFFGFSTFFLYWLTYSSDLTSATPWDTIFPFTNIADTTSISECSMTMAFMILPFTNIAGTINISVCFFSIITVIVLVCTIFFAFYRFSSSLIYRLKMKLAKHREPIISRHYYHEDGQTNRGIGTLFVYLNILNWYIINMCDPVILCLKIEYWNSKQL